MFISINEAASPEDDTRRLSPSLQESNVIPDSDTQYPQVDKEREMPSQAKLRPLVKSKAHQHENEYCLASWLLMLPLFNRVAI